VARLEAVAALLTQQGGAGHFAVAVLDKVRGVVFLRLARVAAHLAEGLPLNLLGVGTTTIGLVARHCI